MEPITLFVISGVGMFGMVSLRMLEIRYERRILLAHVSMHVDKRIKPHAKKLSKTLAERKEALIERLRQIPVRIQAKLGEKLETVKAAWSNYYEFLTESFRGKKMLSGGSVSFFLLNISDYGREADKEKIVERLETPAELSFEDSTGEEEEGAAQGGEEEYEEPEEENIYEVVEEARLR